MAEHQFSKAEFEEATRRGEDELATRPPPESVRYDAASGRIVVDFANGSAFLVPARSLQGLENASDEDLAAVELRGAYGLHWARLDVDFTVPGLMAGIFGTARYMKDGPGKSAMPGSSAKVAAGRQTG